MLPLSYVELSDSSRVIDIASLFLFSSSYYLSTHVNLGLKSSYVRPSKVHYPLDPLFFPFCSGLSGASQSEFSFERPFAGGVYFTFHGA